MINRISISHIKGHALAFFKMVGIKINMHNMLISQYGIYTKPKNKDGLTIDNSSFTIALHDAKNLPISLSDNDVIITDNKSFIHIDNKGGKINIYGKNIKIVADTIEYETDNFNINAKSIDLKSTTLKHNGLEVGSLHTHKVTGSSTTPPI